MYTHSEWDLTKQKPSTQFFFGCYYDLTIFPFTSIIYFIWRVSITLTIFIIFHRTNAHQIGPSIWYYLQSVLFYCRYLFLFLFVCLLFPSLFSLEFFFPFFFGHLLLFIIIRQLCTTFLMPCMHIYQIDEYPSIVCYEHRYVTNISLFPASLFSSLLSSKFGLLLLLLNNCWRWSFKKKPFLCIGHYLLYTHPYTCHSS